MTGPLSSSDQNKIRSVEDALNQYIQNSQSGKGSFNDINALQKQISQLLENEKIPQSVRRNLQAALKELREAQSNKGALQNLNSAKMQLDQALGHEEKGTGEPGKGSLGGGSEEQ